ncbi:MAG: host-nuclease inhibitor Gam family protein [Pseudomonadota bacterium]
MARKKSCKYQCISKDEANAYLLQIGRNKIELNKLEAEMNERINSVKLEYDVKAMGIKYDTEHLELAIEQFAESNKQEFLNKRSMELSFGTIAYRVVERVNIRNIKACVNAIKNCFKDDEDRQKHYIITDEKPNKENLKELDAVTLAKFGVTVKKADQIRIEPNWEKIKVD